MITLFSYCYFADLTAESFKCISNDVYNSPWYELCNSLNQYVILMIRSGQMPLGFKGYKMISINLETFQMVSIIKRWRLKYRMRNARNIIQFIPDIATRLEILSDVQSFDWEELNQTKL